MGILFLVAAGVILIAFFDKTRDRWSFLIYGFYLISIAIFSIVGIELLESIYEKKEFIKKLTSKEILQLKEFVQVITALKWAFTLVAGGIGVNLASYAIINEQAQSLENLTHEKLDEIRGKVLLSNKLIISAIVLMIIGFIALWIKI